MPTESSTNLEPIVTLWVACFAPWCAKYPQTQMKSSSSTKRSGSPRAMLTSPLKSSLSSSGGSSSTARYDSFCSRPGRSTNSTIKSWTRRTVFSRSTRSEEHSVLSRTHETLFRVVLQARAARRRGHGERVAHGFGTARRARICSNFLSVEDGYAEFVLDPFKGTLKTMHAREETAANAESYYPLIRSQLQDWEPDVDPVILARWDAEREKPTRR